MFIISHVTPVTCCSITVTYWHVLEMFSSIVQIFRNCLWKYSHTFRLQHGNVLYLIKCLKSFYVKHLSYGLIGCASRVQSETIIIHVFHQRFDIDLNCNEPKPYMNIINIQYCHKLQNNINILSKRCSSSEFSLNISKCNAMS